jgi:colanic acid/amylovoran biosynthesis protein
MTDPARRVRLERTIFDTIVRVLGRSRARVRDRVVLIAAPGGGNVGDQAMLDACIAGAGGPVDVIVRDPKTLRLPSNAEEHVLPNLLYGGLALASIEAVRFARLVASARSVVIAGADIMDGAYSDTASARRFLLVGAAAQVTDARVVGFSWNAHPKPRALAALRGLPRAVRLLVRDRVSLGRIEPETRAEVLSVADVVFSFQRASESSDASRWMAGERATGRKVLAVNVNAVIEARVPHLRLVRTELSRMIDDGWSIVAVPHDARNAPSDVSLAAELVGDLPAAHVFQAPLLGPAGVLGIAEQADLMLTGRMHLAILGFTRGTPTITIAYQGKVAGLYERIGLSEYVIEPGETLAHDLRAALLRAENDLERCRDLIAAAMPGLRDDGGANFISSPSARTVPAAVA